MSWTGCRIRAITIREEYIMTEECGKAVGRMQGHSGKVGRMTGKEGRSRIIVTAVSHQMRSITRRNKG